MTNSSRSRLLLGALLSIVAATVPTRAQDETPTKVTDQNRSGDLPFSTTVGTDLEHVVVASGNLVVNVPFTSVPGRGMPFNFGIWYDARSLSVVLRSTPNNHQIWNFEKRPYLTAHGLWAPAQPALSYTYYHLTKCYPDVYGPDNGDIEGQNNYIYHDASGGKHSLAADWEVGQCFYLGGNPWSYANAGPDNTGAGLKWDGSNTVLLPNGAKQTPGGLSAPPAYPLDPGTFAGYGTLVDPNGNWKGEFAGGLDTLGRALVTQQNGTNYIQYIVKDSGGTSRTYTINYASATLTTSFGVSGAYGAIWEYSGSREKVTSIVLPNGRSYTFSYDSYGSVTQMTFPTGATINYTWANYPNASCTYRYVSSRTVTVNGQSSTWTFSHAPVGTATCNGLTQVGSDVTVTQTDPLSNQTVYTVSRGNVKTAKFYQGAATGTPLRQYTVEYTDYNNASGSLPPLYLPTRITTQLEDGRQSKKEFTYDTLNYDVTSCWGNYISCDTSGPIPISFTTSRGNVLEIREYDWGPTAPGPLVRRTTKQYLHDSNPAYLPYNIVSKVITSTIYDSAANTCKGLSQPCSQTQYEYDNYVPGDNPLQATTGAPQHSSSYSSTFTMRGNVTRLKRWRNTDGAFLTATYTYDDLGNIRAIKDPLGHTVSYDYTDNFANASCPPPVGSNTQAWVKEVTNALGHHIQVVRYPCTGLVQAHKDQNDINAARAGATFTYDLLGRLTQKNLPDGGQASPSYNDVPPVSATTTTKITASLNLVTTAIADGLGRTTQSKLTSDPQGTIFTDTTFDKLGRTATVSNPYRSTSEPTYGITTSQFDALSRVTKLIPPDGTSSVNNLTTTYAGTCTTVTDQAGKIRKSCADALGRLIQVFEPNQSGSLVNETDYQYNTIDNLTCVVQKGTDTSPFTTCAAAPVTWRPRSFTYNSLSQLLTASNPESGTISYTYDNDGNLLTKVAPAPNQTGSATVTTTFSYDVLHRLAQKSFSDSTPVVKHGYDAVAPSGCTLPTLTITNGIGRRTGMCDAAGAEAWSYDAMGRPLTDRRTTNSVTKDTLYTYNLDGSVATLTYPSGHTITYNYNAAARALSAVDTANTINYATAATYAPAGALASLTNGASLASTFYYNNRLQPCRISVKSSGTAPTTCTDTANLGNVLDFTYGFNAGISNNGNVASIANNRNMARSQSFTYDELNRVKTAQTSSTTGQYCWGETFGYDIWANLLTIGAVSGYTGCTQENLSVTATTKNQISGDTYDSAGNLLSGPGMGPFTYDAENHLLTAGGVTYAYDGDGKRAKKSNGKLYWYGMSSDPLMETDSAGTPSAEFIFFNSKRIARLDLPSAAAHYYFSDHLGSASVVTSATGTIQDESDYYPFGGERTVTNTDPNQYKFTGKERDSESGLDFFGARYYGSNLGRFTSPDEPFADQTESDPQSWNLYSYVRNNPLQFTDPNGEACVQQEDGSYKDDDSSGQSCAEVDEEDKKTNPSAIVTVDSNELGLMMLQSVGEGLSSPGQWADISRRALEEANPVLGAISNCAQGNCGAGEALALIPFVRFGKLGKIFINAQKQARHLPGTAKAGRSILREDAPKLLSEFAGKGSPIANTNKERFDAGRVIGEWVDKKTGASVPTTKGIIHYSNTGAHIVPARP